uniref:Chemosensory protein 9 n=1 Tax=Cyrtorhinus lividipennis TaxID=1032904 RepID=A0A346TI05_9HEMI|nr:chemosensory protein 9 [Cyrtorhinus lividipennis]
MVPSCVTLMLCVLFTLISIVSSAENKYTSKYDKVDVDAIIKNERILKRYVDCLMDRSSCTPDAKLLKALLPDALQTNCAKCTDAQKIMAGKVLGHLLQFKRPYWDELTKKYDPDGSFRKRQGYDEDPDDIDYSNYDDSSRP